MREHQGDNSDEIVLGVGSPEPRLQHVSGSAGWPDDVGDGGEHESLARDSTSDPTGSEDSPSTSTAWDAIQNLPTLDDAPLRADELRNKPSLEPADHFSTRDPIHPTAVIQPRDQTPSPSITTRPRLSRSAEFLRSMLTTISVLVLVAGLALLVWALLSPPQPDSSKPTRLEATSSPNSTTW